MDAAEPGGRPLRMGGTICGSGYLVSLLEVGLLSLRVGCGWATEVDVVGPLKVVLACCLVGDTDIFTGLGATGTGLEEGITDVTLD